MPGQRSQRRKWLNYFQDVDAVIFVCAVSEYDQAIREDNKTNRIYESVTLFEIIANSQYFVDSQVWLSFFGNRQSSDNSLHEQEGPVRRKTR